MSETSHHRDRLAPGPDLLFCYGTLQFGTIEHESVEEPSGGAMPSAASDEQLVAMRSTGPAARACS
ncbi:hypothetical protein ACFYO2_48045 [Streptomyces sp. NPDC006602]|uniref:hypothetical protein n=1 Tax=Streptomyces sp. NPDC006602 TaxID=3364751 RepID=UPI0036817842